MNEERIGIVTIDDYTNYGNRLQNYALTKLLESAGFQVINGIQVYTKEDWANLSNNQFKRLIKRIIPFQLVKNKLYTPSVPKTQLLKRRQDRFVNFVNSYTTIIEPVIISSNTGAYNFLQKKYNIKYYITGSDQVWNPYYQGRSYEFLSFVPKNERLSFAASFGVDEIPKRLVPVYQQYLKEFNYISVREKHASDIVFELTGRDASVTLDPTLLLDRETWELCIRKPKVELQNRFICSYFLGAIPEAVEMLSKKTGLPIYRMNCIEDEDFYTFDPCEFLYMIKNAEYVVTDSFHATVFSIIFNKEFYVFQRQEDGVESMFSRIETITQRFKLENRIQPRNCIALQHSIDNWMWIASELKAEREKSMNELIEKMSVRNGKN